MTVVYSDGSLFCDVTINREVFRQKCGEDGADILATLEQDGKRIVALVPIPITPGHETIRRKAGMT